jgi:hypothetical protein
MCSLEARRNWSGDEEEICTSSLAQYFEVRHYAALTRHNVDYLAGVGAVIPMLASAITASASRLADQSCQQRA